VSFSIYFFSPELSLYVGLSGVLHGLFCWGVIQDIRKKLITGYLLFLGVALKIGSEQLFGAGTLMPSLIEADVAVDSHLYGVIFGTIGGIVSALFYYKNKTA
jgi:rhomboid family GlyGly-CTERM serine protease